MEYLEIVLAGVIWACTGPLVKLIQAEGFASLDIVLGRSAISACLLGLYLLLSAGARKRRKRRAAASQDRAGGKTGAAGDTREIAIVDQEPLILDARDLVSLALLGFLAVVFAQTTYFYSLSKTSVAVAVTLNYTSPFFVMAISFLVYKEPVTKGKITALAGAVLGVALASGLIGPQAARSGMSVPGVTAGILSGFGYGLQTVVYKRVGRKYGPIPLNFWTMALGGLHLSAAMAVMNRRFPDVFARLVRAPASTWLWFFLIGLGPGTVAFILFADGINKVDATTGSIVAMSEPVAACLLGYFVLGETLAPTQIAGVALVLMSIWTVSIPEAKTRRKKDAGSRLPG